ncbi:MAG TPA: hypothetical protein DIW47_05030 [Bacteroidetes bacterium]|nr:hypothetical protein [Bacteroidota bacterium]
MRKRILLLSLVFSCLQVIAQNRAAFPIQKVLSENRLTLNYPYPGTSYPSFDSVQSLFLYMGDFLSKSNMAIPSLPDFPMLETVTISFYQNDSLWLNYIHNYLNSDSLYYLVNAKFKSWNLKSIRVYNPQYGWTDSILNKVFNQLESVTNVSLDYGELDSIQTELPSFLKNFPKLSTLTAFSFNHPVVVPDEYLSQLPTSMQSSSIQDKLCLLKEMYEMPNEMFACNTFNFYSNKESNIFGVFVGNFCGNETVSIGSTLDSLPKNRDKSLSAMYVVNGLADNFFNITDKSVLGQMKCLYVFGDLSRAKIKFLSKLESTNYIINVIGWGNKIIGRRDFLCTNIILLKTQGKKRRERKSISPSYFEFLSKSTNNRTTVFYYLFLF